MFKNREEVLKIKEKYTGKRVYVEINDMLAVTILYLILILIYIP